VAKRKSKHNTEHFDTWEDCAVFFEDLLDDFHESNPAEVSEQMAVNKLLRALSVLQFRLNASVNQDVRSKRTR